MAKRIAANGASPAPADKSAETPPAGTPASSEIKTFQDALAAAQAEERRLMEELAAAHKVRADAEQALADAQEE